MNDSLANTPRARLELLPLGDDYGCHRAVEPRGSLPQPAWRLDNDFRQLFRGELLLDVDTLNIDAASFRQMEESAPPEFASSVETWVAASIRKTVAERGKQHNPVTGSGGMLLGRVAAISPSHPDAHVLRVGDRVASLVSLSLTPLSVPEVVAMRRSSAQVDVRAQAVLFASGAYAKIPSDLSERLALAVLDVAGAAPQVARLVPPNRGFSVCVLGAGGKSGMLCVAEARRVGGENIRIIGVENYPPFAAELRELGLCDVVLELDARDPVAVRRGVLSATNGEEVDLVLSCVNVPDAEMSAVLVTRPRGTAYFFAMSTSFTKAALGAEGVGKDISLLIGNGFAKGHAEHSLAMMREMPRLAEVFERRYG